MHPPPATSLVLRLNALALRLTQTLSRWHLWALDQRAVETRLPWQQRYLRPLIPVAIFGAEWAAVLLLRPLLGDIVTAISFSVVSLTTLVVWVVLETRYWRRLVSEYRMGASS